MVNPDEIKSSTAVGVDGRKLHNPSNEPLPPAEPKLVNDGSPPVPNTQNENAPDTGADKPQVS